MLQIAKTIKMESVTSPPNKIVKSDFIKAAVPKKIDTNK
jgi:hypothetical protein